MVVGVCVRGLFGVGLIWFYFFPNVQPYGFTLNPQISKSECLTFSLGILKKLNNHSL